MNNLTTEQAAEAVRHEFIHKYNALESQKTLKLNAQQNQIQAWSKAAEQRILSIRQIGQSVQFPNGFQQSKEYEITQNLQNDIWILQSQFKKAIDEINNLQDRLKHELDAFLIALTIKASQNVNEVKESEIQGQNVDITDNAGEFEDDKKDTDECIAPANAAAVCEDKDSESISGCVCNVNEGELGHSMKEQCYLWQMNDIANKLTARLGDCLNAPIMSTVEKDGLFDEFNELNKKLQHIGNVLSTCKTFSHSNLKDNEMNTQNWREISDIISSKTTKGDDNSVVLGTNNDNSNDCEDDEKMKEELEIALENARADCASKGQVFPYSKKITMTKDFYEKYGKQYGTLMPQSYQNDKVTRGGINRRTRGKATRIRNVSTIGSENTIVDSVDMNKNKIQITVDEVAVNVAVRITEQYVPDCADIFDEL